MFDTTATLRNSTPIPRGVALEKAVELLQGHEFCIQCDPHLVKYEAIDTPSPEPEISQECQASAMGPPQCFRVTDKIHALPGGLWDSDVVSTYEFINIERGTFVRIRGPMNTILESVWEVQQSEDGGLVLVEDVVIKCSRLMVGIVRSTCEDGWRGIHKQMIDKLMETQGE
ncbi:hypothetical protein CDD83_7828 [Cordyceps sp. RAO-2017]|nr:hypothetical protein CDD83_7828 [Cordyceps sp. RAO-2017]